MLNESGRITDKYRYDAYGKLAERSGETENHYLYTGEYYDGVSDLYYLRARYMSTSTGTFTSMDTYEGSIYDPDTLHKYLYANGNPVKYTDPSGNMFGSVLVSAQLESNDSKINGIDFKIGMEVLKRARSVVNINNMLSLALSYKISKMVYDYYLNIDKISSYDLNYVITDIVIGVVWPWKKSKEEEQANAISIARDEEKKGNVYYHATSVINAAVIVAMGVLIGSEYEGGYVFTWRRCPDKKALKLSGARNAEVIIQFRTQNSFCDDWGIDNAYVKSFGPVRSFLKGPVYIQEPIIMPVLY